MKKNEKFMIKELMDEIEDKIYIFKIYYASHEIDGYLIAKQDIDLKDGLGDLIFYPNEESIKQEEELARIKKESKILIEVKQNTT